MLPKILPDFFLDAGYDPARLLRETVARLDGVEVTFGRIKTASLEAAARLIRWAESIGGEGEVKRAAVLAGVGGWFDAFVKPRLTGWRSWFAPLLRWALLWVVNQALDGLVAVVKRADELSRQMNGPAADAAG